jgi:hypothetical protein
VARTNWAPTPIAVLRRKALYKGLVGGSRGWLAVGAFVWLPMLLKKALGRTEQLVAKEVLKPGQTLCIEAIEPQSRAQRKR